jgi:hypothetical protein
VVAFFLKGETVLLTLSTLLVIYWYVLRLPLRRFLLRIRARSATGTPQRFEGEADEEGLRLNDTRIRWEEIRRVVSLVEGFVADYNGLLLFIPASAFETLEAKNDFAKLARKYANAYIDAKTE